MFGARGLPLVAPFDLALKPTAGELGELCDDGINIEAVFLFSFGNATASHRVKDVWPACCELYLQAQLVHRSQLHQFDLAGEELFTVAYSGDVILCAWSTHHVFAVERHEFVRSSETLVDQFLSRVSTGGRDDFVRLGASMIQNHDKFAALRRVEMAC